MACSIYDELITNWKQLICQPHEDDDAVNAYWAAVDHRAICEVCKDENLAVVLERLSRIKLWNF
jgi:hypothetical protein